MSTEAQTGLRTGLAFALGVICGATGVFLLSRSETEREVAAAASVPKGKSSSSEPTFAPRPGQKPPERKEERFEPPNASELRDELASIEAEFEELRPDLTKEYRAWRGAWEDLEYWQQELRDLRNWAKTVAFRESRAYQQWIDEDNGIHAQSRREKLARASQPQVIEQLHEFLRNPDSAERTQEYLEKYAAASEPADAELESHWKTALSSLPPRDLVRKLLDGEPLELGRTAEASGVPDDIMGYAWHAFDNRFQRRIISDWIESSKPESLRRIRVRWNELNERRVEILVALGHDFRTISKY